MDLYIKLKGITKCSNMVAEILQADPYPHDPLEWCQNSTLSNMVMLKIRLKGIAKCHNMVAKPQTPSKQPRPQGFG